MEQRYATSPEHMKGMDTTELREKYLVEELFTPDEITAVYTHHDRVVVAGVTPVTRPLVLTGYEEIRSEHFFEHREAGVVNVGGEGTVTVDGETYTLAKGAFLYIGREASDPEFTSADADQPAQFYVFSAPAHTAYPTTLVEPGGGNVLELGDGLTSNRRTLTQVIHANGVKSCQVVMGVTQLHPGSMWNTMPAHTHDRRTELYLYFDLPADASIVHLMGTPQETRHLMVQDRQVVISPSWSMHAGVGTASYSFVWAMAGENQEFTDMDGHPVTTLR